MSDIEGPGTEGSQPQPSAEGEVRSTQDRKKILADAIQREVVQGGRIQSQAEFQAVLVKGERPNHTVHAIVTIFTCGLWGIPWIVISLTGGERRTMITVDDYGNALVQQLGKQ
jgi:hypothetical protein